MTGVQTCALPIYQIVIPEASISGQHAQLEVRSESLSITDLGSTNGTFVNGRQLAENETAQLTEGMSLTLGAVEFRVSR